MGITLFIGGTLFIAFLVKIFFHLRNEKVHAWLQPFFSNKSSASAAPITAAPQAPKILTSQDAAELKKLFSTFDKNGDGFITKQELRESLKNIRIFMPEQEVAEVFKKLDINGDGLIDFDEFCGLCESMGGEGGDGCADGGKDGERGEIREGDLKEAFDVFDKDKDGLITVKELGLVLSGLGFHEGKKEEDCREMIRKVDKDGDGMINFSEFKEMMRCGRTLVPAY